jgi:hypothetical protein
MDRPPGLNHAVPFGLDLARNDEERRLLEFLYAGQGLDRPFVAPPDLPPDWLKLLRAAFNATMRDAVFIAETRRRKLDLEPEDGEHLMALVRRMYTTPKPIVDRVGNLIK